RTGQLAVTSHGPRIGRGDARMAADLFEFLVAAGDWKLLDVEGIGPGLVQDGGLDRGVQSLNKRDDRDDRRHRDDVAQDGHERPELRRPDGVQRDARRFEELVHRRYLVFLLSTFTRS